MEIVNGGYVQHDEASTSLMGALVQTTFGQRFLAREFDEYRVRTGYHIDPFGHSAATPALFLMSGYDASVINRIDERVKEARANAKSLEFYWRTSLLPGQPALFTHILRQHYGDWHRESNWLKTTKSLYRNSVRHDSSMVLKKCCVDQSLDRFSFYS
jgi:lysosomal alpha-mannosidase